MNLNIRVRDSFLCVNSLSLRALTLTHTNTHTLSHSHRTKDSGTFHEQFVGILVGGIKSDNVSCPRFCRS